MRVESGRVRRRVALLATVAALSVAWSADPASAQSTLDRGPNLDGPWASEAGVLHFNTMHRFWVTDPPTSKVVNTPTILLGAGLGHGILVGTRYASNSRLVPGEFNEWELFTRWAPLRESAGGVVDAGVTGAWNTVAGSVDGEVAVARSFGPVRAQLAGRAFSAFRGGDGAVALGGAAVWRVTRHVAVAGDVVSVLSGAEVDPAWSVGLQLQIPYTPHTVSIHTSTASATTLQGSSFDSGEQFWGFEFTVPVTLSRFFGGRAPSSPAPEPAVSAGDTAVVGMDNRLRFLPDTIRIQVGQAIRWENQSDLVHTVTADRGMAALESSVSLPAGASPFDSGDLVPGDSYTRTFDVPGQYRYFCIPHERAGMVGVIIVEER